MTKVKTSVPDVAPSLVEVARRANVSLGTASRVMNGEDNVNPDLRKQVLIAGREIRFVPKVRRRHLALITDHASTRSRNGYVSTMTSLMTQSAVARGLGVELVEINNLDDVYDCHIDGVVGVVFDDRILELRSIPNLPVVTINHPMPDSGIHSVYTDHYGQGRIAAQYLVEQGHRRIAFLAMNSGEWGAQRRLEGYLDVLKESGIEPEAAWTRFSESQPVYDILRRWVRNDVTAVLNFGEDVAMEVIHILRNVLGLRIGQDISTITLEDWPVYQYFTPPQTVIRQPLEELAMRAVDIVIRQSDALHSRGEAIEDVVDICLHGSLVERDSVAPVSSGDKERS